MASTKALALALDADAVMSAWEKIGGSAFSCDDFEFPEDPLEVSLDLSSFMGSKSDSQLSQLFPPSDLTRESPGTVPATVCPPPLQRSWSNGAQVVPQMPPPIPFGAPMPGHMPPLPLGIPFSMVHHHAMPLPLAAYSAPAPTPATLPHQQQQQQQHPKQQPESQAAPQQHLLGNVFSYESDEDLMTVPSMDLEDQQQVQQQPPAPAASKRWGGPKADPDAAHLQEPGPGARPVASLSSCASDAGVVPDVTSPAAQQPHFLAGAGGGAAQRGGHHGPAQQHAAATRAHQGRSDEAEYVRTRAECLERYRQKKARRMYTKKIRYQLRKINADKRPRIKGRFVKKAPADALGAAEAGAGGPDAEAAAALAEEGGTLGGAELCPHEDMLDGEFDFDAEEALGDDCGGMADL